MRIISGIKKGKKILLPDKTITRPLKDNVKENIFNILLHSRNFQINFKNTKVIDFFSGSGSFGLECISRGSKKVKFIENNSKIQNTLYRNLSNNFDKNKFEKDKFFDLFNKSVEKRLLSDVPLANLLSGGIDSTSIIKAQFDNKITPSL